MRPPLPPETQPGLKRVDNTSVRRLLLITLGIAATLVPAVPAWANWAGNFHLKGGAPVGCHWASFGGVAPAWATSGSIRCERYRDHAFVEITRKGRLIVKSHYKGWVAPGTNGNFPGVLSHHLSCVVLWVMNISTGRREQELSCSYWSKTATGLATKEFSIAANGPIEIKRS